MLKPKLRAEIDGVMKQRTDETADKPHYHADNAPFDRHADIRGRRDCAFAELFLDYLKLLLHCGSPFT